MLGLVAHGDRLETYPFLVLFSDINVRSVRVARRAHSDRLGSIPDRSRTLSLSSNRVLKIFLWDY